jgi:DNA mismatch endonuclease (patch repair protein)
METRAVRRRTMRAVKSKNTAPELFVRKVLHAQGYRYRLHRSDFPGCHDIVFPGRKKVMFIHGCFWHGHDCPRGARVPKTNQDYWVPKIARNRARDAANYTRLHSLGWDILTIWECEVKLAKTTSNIEKFLLGFRELD